MKKRKKSLVGWTFNNWWLEVLNGVIDHAIIIPENCEKKQLKKFWGKVKEVRITIEEL